MSPYNGSRAEAERWLGIAEKLLAGRDLVGSKIFAIRAREADPSIEAAGQIVAVADTLIAGEKRINNQPDWYAILQLFPQTGDTELIAVHYRRLALLLNPRKNRLPFADHAFTLVSYAWSVLSNPSKKFLYDNDLNLLTKFDPSSSRRQEESQPFIQNSHHEQFQPRPQPQQQQRQQQLKRQQQPQEMQIPQQQQPQEQVATESPIYVNDNTARDRNATKESEIQNNQDENSTFWTACPYCYFMYEYPSVYEDCTLQCQNCRRGFQSVKVAAPPAIAEGKEAYFYCWGFIPLGVSVSNLEKNKGGVPAWTPFSPMFTCSQQAGARAPKNVNARKSSASRLYIDDDQEDVLVGISSSDGSDDEWDGTRKKKEAKNVKGKSPSAKHVKKSTSEKG